MATKLCLTHRDRPAAAFCHRCHKPVCKECLLVTSQGSFCSSECHVIAREFRERMKGQSGPRPGGAWKKAGIAAIVVILCLTIAWFMLGEALGLPDPFEMFGKLMKKAKQR